MKWNKLYKNNILILITALFVLPALNYGQGIWDKKPENLKVLPDTTSPNQLRQVMHMFTTALDVHCNYCHDDSKGKDFNSIDFPSDAKDTKKVARVMMQMVQKINDDFISRANQIEQLQGPVTCVTCHHGIAHIQSLSEILLQTYNNKGIDSTFNKYNELKKKYYGGFTFDFRDNSLNDLGNEILNSKNYNDAIKIFEFNANMFPNSWQAYDGLGECYLAIGDKTKAKENFKKSLSINSFNRRAQEALRRLE